MSKQNCWDYKKCGRGPDTGRKHSLKACLAAAEKAFDGINGGKNAGRICWLVAGTLCDGKTKGTYARKRRSCLSCDFFKKVSSEEGNEKFVVRISKSS